MICLATYKRDLFTVMKVFEEYATLFGGADYNIMVYQYGTDSSERTKTFFLFLESLPCQASKIESALIMYPELWLKTCISREY